MEDEIKFSRAEILDAVAARIEAKKGGSVDGDEDHEFVGEFTRACNEYVEKHPTVSVFTAASKVVALNPVLGKRFCAYIFEDSRK